MSRISKLLKEARDRKGVEFKQRKVFIPVDCQVPETPKVIMAKTMLSSGLISLDEYNKMLGISFDMNDVREKDERWFDEDEEDEFKMSSFAEYEDFIEYNDEEVNNVPKEEEKTTPEDDVESVGRQPSEEVGAKAE